MATFLHTAYQKHSTKLVPGANFPAKEVDHFEMAHINRRVFQGESAIRLVERILNIDAGIGGNPYRMGQYKNSHASWDNDRQGQGNLGKRQERPQNDDYNQ